jgi:hypothetical protein
MDKDTEELGEGGLGASFITQCFTIIIYHTSASLDISQKCRRRIKLFILHNCLESLRDQPKFTTVEDK